MLCFQFYVGVFVNTLHYHNKTIVPKISKEIKKQYLSEWLGAYVAKDYQMLLKRYFISVFTSILLYNMIKVLSCLLLHPTHYRNFFYQRIYNSSKRSKEQFLKYDPTPVGDLINKVFKIYSATFSPLSQNSLVKGI